jgi:hypothetical protein
LSALSEDGRASRAMNRAIHAPSAQKGRIRRIHDRIGSLCSDVRGAVDLDHLFLARLVADCLSAIERQSDCEGVHASVQKGHFFSVVSNV